MRTRWFVVWLTLLAACQRETPTSARPRFAGGSGTAIHTLTLAAGDTDVQFGSWISAINADCSDTVIGQFAHGLVVVRLQDSPEYHIKNTCTPTNPNKTVEIRGWGQDSSIIVVNSTAYEITGGQFGGGFGLIVDDAHVHVHGYSFFGNAYDFPNAAEDGNSGEAIKFNPTATYGEADHLWINDFGTSGVDVYGAQAAYVHDNSIVCPTSALQGYSNAAMGIWARNLNMSQLGSLPNVNVTGNWVYNCGAEGVVLEGASHAFVISNEVFCQYAVCSGGSIGIALYGDSSANCTDFQVSNNLVYGNRIYANNGFGLGIAIKVGGGHTSGGSGHNNVIDSNFVTNTTAGIYTEGIYVSQYSCTGDTALYHGFSGNVIKKDSVSNSWNAQIWNGGAQDSILNNTIVVGRGIAADSIYDASRTAIISGNH